MPGLASAALLAALTIAPAAQAADVVRLARIGPLSGSPAATGQLGVQHVRFAVARANATHAAGPNRRLELVPFDAEASPKITVRTTLERVAEREVTALLAKQKLGTALTISERLYAVSHDEVVFEGTPAAHAGVRRGWLEAQGPQAPRLI